MEPEEVEVVEAEEVDEVVAWVDASICCCRALTSAAVITFCVIAWLISDIIAKQPGERQLI
jgi:hypothetical protein